MSLKDAKLLEVLASFARIAGAELEADLEPGRRVTIEIQGVGWRSALDRICAGHGLACRFEGEPPVLRVAEVEKAGLADRGATSPRRREPMVLAVKLREGDREVTGLARFDWNTSTFRLGDAELGNRLDLVWLPLKPDGEGLLVLLSDCASGQVRHTGLVTPREMLGIGRGSWGWGGRENFTTKLSLRRPGKEELSDLQEAATESPACPLAEGPPVEIRFGEDGRHRVLLAGARGRAVVLAGHRGAPALALVHLGAFGDQGAKVAVVSPGYVGAALTTYSLSPSRDQGPSLVLTHLGLALHLESEEPR